MHPDVSVCIPAWEAAGFIDRTLACARSQTHDAISIVVSIDDCDDATEELCRVHAREDARVEVHAQSERLGWARNVNYLLDHVRTEFAFLYFHDDLIEPTYVDSLVGALRERPDAASAHCDMGHFGGSAKVNPGRQYEGSVVERLVTLLVAPDRGSLLRSMMRREAMHSDVRMPTASGRGVWANEPFVFRVVAAGPALHVPQTLYRRWDKREGGMTESWLGLDLDEIIEGHRVNTADALAVIDSLPVQPDERDVLMFALYVYMTARLRTAERNYGASDAHTPGTLHPRFTKIAMPPALRDLPDELRAWVETRYERLQRMGGSPT